ncbi:MAG: hypothetical protein FWJ93_03800 [Micromonosporaceae bacterium]
MPYTLVREAGGPSRPATFVDYTGATVLQALVRLLRDGHDVTRMSIETRVCSKRPRRWAAPSRGTPAVGT